MVFENGFFANGVKFSGMSNDGFPDGFFRVPFDYYFRGPNPRIAVPASDPVRARQLIAAELDKARGVWLVSGKKLPEAMKEVPQAPDIRLASESSFGDIVVLHFRRSGS